MVLKADVLAAAIDAVSPPRRPASAAADVAARTSVSPVGGARAGGGARRRHPLRRFEGVDERVISGRNLQEVSVGDYVSVRRRGGGAGRARRLRAADTGVMGKIESAAEESHEAGLLEHPHYTRPARMGGGPIPDILLSGDHARIARGAVRRRERLTRERRPDLLK